MKTEASNIRKGWIIRHNGNSYSVLSASSVKPGKGGAYMQVEMRDIETGNKANARFRTSESVEKLETADNNAQFLFSDMENLNFMDMQTYEQFTLPREIMGENSKLLKEEMDVIIKYVDGKAVSVELPKSVIAKVVETESVIKGQTAASSNKPAVLDNGLRVMVPPFVKVDDEIVINTTDLTYMERAK